VAAGQLGLTGEAQPIFFPNPQKTTKLLLLEAQQHKKYAQTTPLDDEVSFLFYLVFIICTEKYSSNQISFYNYQKVKHKTYDVYLTKPQF
jgi:hypothetical protein